MYYFLEPMNDTDIEHVQQIERTSFTTVWSSETYRQELRNPTTHRYMVARMSTVPPPPRNGTHYTTNGHGKPSLRTLLSRLLSTHTPMIDNQHYPIVGYGGLSVYYDEGHIMTVAVAHAYRGQGIGELLLNGLIDLAFEMNVTVLTLEVRISNTIAQNLYQKYGFHLCGNRPRYYTDNGEDALIMTTEPIHTNDYQQKLQVLRWHLFTRLRTEAENSMLGRDNGKKPLPDRREGIYP